MTPQHNILAIVGPTSVGKTEIAIRVALELGGEVVSADSRQVYRFMDIGTAKPTTSQLSSVPHHLINVIDPDEEYNLAMFLQHARRVIPEIIQRSMLPIIVGGSGQYVWGLLEGWRVPQIPPNLELRRSLEERIGNEGVAKVHAELSRLDPKSAKRIDPTNPRRVVRALEVYYSSNEQVTSSINRTSPPFSNTTVGLTLERSALYRRVERRIDAMIEAGWVKEVEELLCKGYDTNLPSMSGLGYAEIAQHIQGVATLEEAVDKAKSRTRKFVRHQNSWFKRDDSRIEWVDSTDPELLEKILQAFRNTTTE